jgi:hypothetical protein
VNQQTMERQNEGTMPATLAPEISMKRCRDAADEWDQFAMRCGASFRAGYHAARAWQLDHHLFFRLRRFCCYLRHEDRPIKIAQVAVGFGWHRRVFAEGLMLLPEYEQIWGDVLAVVLSRLGAGVYHYGSPWSLEPSREAALASTPGITVIDVRHITVDVIDFAGWDSWCTYLKNVSTNAKRNARRAEKTFTTCVVETYSGAAALKHLHHRLTLHKVLRRRKGLRISTHDLVLRYVTRVMAMGRNAFTSIAYADGVPTATFSGVMFGSVTYYLEAGSLDERNGVSWLLTLRMIRDAYERAPTGRFVISYRRADRPDHPGLAFFRSQCCATSVSTSEVVFQLSA